MAATERELLTARIFMRAAFPVMKVVLEDLPSIGNRFRGVSAKVQFLARNAGEDVGACLVFDPVAGFHVEQGIVPGADIVLEFSSVAKMNTLLKGGAALPRVKGITHLGLLIKTVVLLLSLKLMMPFARPKDLAKKRLKVKMTIYMITTALSQYNKGGDPEIRDWTSKQPDRIYQMSVAGTDIAAYLRVRAGQTKAGRGLYARRQPFVHMRFHSVDGALAVLNKEAEFIESVAKGYVSVDGSPEYAAQLNDFMMRIQSLVM
ncbi:MAG: hypothetical protein JXR83_15675 [Deltaproteobacteria bacterium]|nr:hypothetical protein [Deltaproteobacteria bacterium]